MKRLLLASACVLLAACATLPPRRAERAAERVVAWINAGEAEKLAAASRTPFLLDGELLLLADDVAAFWRTALASGLRIEPTAAASARPLDADSYRRFASTMEVRTFFENYVSSNGSLVALEGGGLRILLLLEPGSWGRVLIVGFKGPDPL